MTQTELSSQAQAEIGQARTLDELEAIRLKYLGRKGEITRQLMGLRDLDPSERKSVGAALNQAKGAIGEALEARKRTLQDAALDAALAAQAVDVTLPGRAEFAGLGPPDDVDLDPQAPGERLDAGTGAPAGLEHRCCDVGVTGPVQFEMLCDPEVESVARRRPATARMPPACCGQPGCGHLDAHATRTKSAIGAKRGSVSTTARSRFLPRLTRLKSDGKRVLFRLVMLMARVHSCLYCVLLS